MGRCGVQRHRGGGHAQPLWVYREEGLPGGSWPRPRASISRAITYGKEILGPEGTGAEADGT